MRLIFYRTPSFELSKKSLAPSQGQQGFYYALYNVTAVHFILSLCPVGRFRSAGLFYCRLKSCLFQKYFWKFSKKQAESGVSGVILAEREKSTRHPHGKGVRRWKLSLATMANSTDSMRSAKRCFEMRPGTITEIRNVCLTVKSHSAFFRWKNWGSSRV